MINAASLASAHLMSACMYVFTPVQRFKPIHDTGHAFQPLKLRHTLQTRDFEFAVPNACGHTRKGASFSLHCLFGVDLTGCVGNLSALAGLLLSLPAFLL